MEAWAALGDEVAAVETPQGPLGILAARADAVAAAAAGPTPAVHLLGAFDSLLLAYADRGLHLGPGDAQRVNAGGGMVRPVLVSGGVVCGVWAYRKVRAGRLVEVRPFRPLDAEEETGVEAEAERIGGFFGTDPPVVAYP